jgi:hypothetical protein
MHAPRWTIIGTLVAVIVVSFGTASAAPPANDTIGGAIVVSTFPYSNTQDTTQATTDAQDSALNEFCGAPATDASVWYKFTPSTDTDVFVDVSASDYSSGVLVGSGSPGSLELVACGPHSVFFSATGGTTYYMLVIDDQLFDGGDTNGGLLSLSIGPPPPPPTLSGSANPTGTLTNGKANIRGTATCSGEGVEFAQVDGTLQETVNGVKVKGTFFAPLTCDGKPHGWSATVKANKGSFVPGQSRLQAEVFACNVATCVSTPFQRVIQLV